MYPPGGRETKDRGRGAAYLGNTAPPQRAKGWGVRLKDQPSSISNVRTSIQPTGFRPPGHGPAGVTRTARRAFSKGNTGLFPLGRAAAGGERRGILSSTRAGCNRPAISRASLVMGARGKVNWRPSIAQADRERPPAIFWFLLHHCKRNPPEGGIPLPKSLCVPQMKP